MDVEKLKVAFADTFIMYFRAHSYHWNVIGPRFYFMHDFFGDIYEEVYGSIDTLAEHIRIRGSYAPISLNRIKELSTIVEDEGIPVGCNEMLRRLSYANDMVIMSLNDARQAADEENHKGLAAYLDERIDAHKKHQWMIDAHLKE